MAKCSRYVLRGIAAIMLLVLLGICPIPVLAAVALPDSLEIQMVQAYQNTREDGDQLYLVTYYINYEAEEDMPNEDAGELFIFRLLDADGNEVASAKPFPFYNYGYGSGVVAFYFEPDEVPIWRSSLSVQIIGNPLIEWSGGDPPITTTDSMTWNTGTTEEIQKLVSAKIIYLATQLEQAWAVEMTAVSGGMTILSDTGASYFLRVVPHLIEVGPYVLGQYTFTPEFPEGKPSEDTYANTLVEALDGTIFDLSGPARSLKTSPGVLAASIYYPLVVAFFILLLNKQKLNKGTMFLVWPFVIAGAFIGVPLIVTILAAFISFVSTTWVIYKGTT